MNVPHLEMWISVLLELLFICSQVQAKAVFAYFAPEQFPQWDVDAWKTDIYLAQIARLDAFSLLITPYNITRTINILDNAFAAAEGTDFHLFLTFDYTGSWPMDKVVDMIQKYAGNSAYYKHNGQPLVSTWNGGSFSADWRTIKSRVDIYFVPQWPINSAYFTPPNAPNGLLSALPWAWGNDDINTYVDAAYEFKLNQYGPNLTYMMPISPWFYKNAQDGENIIWKGENQWFDRWQQALIHQPDFVQIFSWNMYEQSHYIGPIHKVQQGYLSSTLLSFDYVSGMPHDGWRMFLPYLIDMYKLGTATITSEGLVIWYRLSPRDARGCSDGNTTVNNALQYQIEYKPQDVVPNDIYYAALLGWEQPVNVTVNGQNLGASWTHKPSGGVGLYRGSVAYGSNTGDVVISIGSMTFKGKPIMSNCSAVSGQENRTNWNAWVGSKAGNTIAATPALNINQQVCIEGHGIANYASLCKFTCSFGFCPTYACICTALGPQAAPPNDTTPGYGTVGYPIASMDTTYTELCQYACNYGFCPSNACGTQQVALSPYLRTPYYPPSCTSGWAGGNLAGLCNYACHYGYCPIHSCTCESQGPAIDPPPITGSPGRAAEGLDPFLYNGLCAFSCSRGYCPASSCISAAASSASSGITPTQPSAPAASSTSSGITPTQPSAPAASSTSSGITPTQPSAPSATHAYDIYQWNCPGPQQVYHFNLGLASGDACSSLNNEIGSKAPVSGQIINVCGRNKTVGFSTINGALQIGDNGVCRPIIGSVPKAGCSDKSMVACTVRKVYECSDIC